MSAVVPTQDPTGSRHFLGDVLTVWGLSLLVGVFAGAGLAPALRGARSGLDQAILLIDRVAGTTSQFAAIVTWLLCVHLSLTCLRVARPRVLGLFVVVLAILPVVTLMSAQRVPVGEAATLLALLSTGLALLGAALQTSGPRPEQRNILLLAGVSLLGQAFSLLLEENAPRWAGALADLGFWFGAVGTAGVLWLQTRISRWGNGLLPLVLFGGLFGAQSLAAGSAADAPFGVVLLGRTFDALLLTGDANNPRSAAGYFLCVALLTLAWTLLVRLRAEQREHAGFVVLATLSLCVQLGPSPLALAAATLAGLALVVLSQREPPVTGEL